MARREGFDVVVVGGGAAGCVIARRLSESADRTVLLLEAGPDLRTSTAAELRDGWHLPTLPDWGLKAEPGPTGAAPNLRRGRLLGGTSWLTRFAVRGASSDFDSWEAGGNPGWAFADVLPSFRRLEADAEYGDRPWHGDVGPMPITRYPEQRPSDIHAAALRAFKALGYPAVEDHNAPGAMGVGPMPMNSRSGERVTSLDAYLPSGAGSEHLSIRPDSMIASVIFDAGRVTGVRLIDGTTIGADLVILSAGTYGSPPILMRSGIGPGDHLRSLGLQVRVELPGVGSGLADHPSVEFDSGWRGPVPGRPTVHSISTYRSAGASATDGPDLMFWVTGPSADDPAFWMDTVLLRPESRGSVRLRSADATDLPRIELPRLTEPADVDRLVEGYRRGLELANHPEIRRMCTQPPPPDPGDDAALRRFVVDNAHSIPHVVGTCAMGPAPEHGAVVDATGRVHGVAGLAVIDASIMPEPPSGFPHIITMMIAEHLSETLRA